MENEAEPLKNLIGETPKLLRSLPHTKTSNKYNEKLGKQAVLDCSR